MKWTFNEPSLMAPLSWAEWTLMVCVLFILIIAGWELIKLFRILFEVMKGGEK